MEPTRPFQGGIVVGLPFQGRPPAAANPSLCGTTASRYPFSCLPGTCVEQRGALPQGTVIKRRKRSRSIAFILTRNRGLTNKEPQKCEVRRVLCQHSVLLPSTVRFFLLRFLVRQSAVPLDPRPNARERVLLG